MEFLIGIVVGAVVTFFILQQPKVQEFIAKFKD